MRTDRFFLTATALSGALLAMPPGPLAAQDTLEAPPVEVIRSAPAARSGDLVSGGRDLRIAGDEEVHGRVVLAGGDLVVEGRVTGDVTVTGGDVRLADGAVVEGNVHVTGGDLVNAGSVGGDVRVVGGRLINENGTIAGEMRIMDRAEVVRPSAQRPRAGAARFDGRGWMGRVGEGLGGLASTMALGLLLAGLGAGLVYFAHPQLERVSESVRRETLRAGAIGIASHFLVLPVFLLGVVLLALTLIGIPLIFLFAPLFWVGVVALAACGVVAVAHAVGERSAEKHGSFEPRHRNSYTYVFTGLGILLAPLVAANLLKLTGFLFGFGALLEVLAKMGLWVAATVGLGALLITRGGMGPNWRWKRRSYDPIIDGDAFGERHHA